MRLKVSHLTLSALLLGATALTACSNSGGTQNGGGHGITDTSRASLRMDALGITPVADYTGSYVVRINNYSNIDYILESVAVVDSLKSDKQSDLVSINGKLCGILVANGNCSIQFTPKTHHSADVILEAKLKNKISGTIEVLRQIIRMSDNVSAQDGIKFIGEIGNVATLDGNYSAAIPVVLMDDFDDVKAFNGSLLCNTGGFHKGNTCTYLLQGKALADNTLVTAKLTGYKKHQTKEVKTNFVVRVGAFANLVLSHGKSISDANGVAHAEVTVFNNGTATAENLSLTEKSPLTASFVPNCTSIAQSTDCKITVTADSEASGNAGLSLKYDIETGKPETVSTNIAYLGAQDVGINVSSSGSLTDLLPGTTAEQTFTITNNGKRTLKKLSAVLTNADKSVLEIRPGNNPHKCTSLNNFELAPNDKCELKVIYTPGITGGRGTAELFIKGSYQGVLGQNEVPYNNRTDVPYSSIIDANYIALENVPERLNITTGDGSALGNTTRENFIIFQTASSNKQINLLSSGFVLTNGSTAGAALKIEGMANSAFNVDACDFSGATALNQRCSADIVFGHSLTAIGPESVNMRISYREGGTNSFALVSDPIIVSAQANNVVIRTTIEAVHSNLFDLSGTGASFAAHTFTGLSNRYLSYKYTFKNEGNQAAEHFDITPELPLGSQIEANLCPGGSNASLAADSDCVYIVKVPSALITSQAAFAGDNVGVGALTLMPTISYYNGTATSATKERLKLQARYINYTRNWAQATYTVNSNFTADENGFIKVNVLATVVRATNFPSGGNENITIKIKDDSKFSHFSGKMHDLQDCTIIPAENSCTLSFKINKADFPGGEYSLVAEATAPAAIIADPIMNIFSFTLPDIHSYSFTGDDSFDLTTGHGKVVLHYAGDLSGRNREVKAYIHTGFLLDNPDNYALPINPLGFASQKPRINHKSMNNLPKLAKNKLLGSKSDDIDLLTDSWNAFYFCKDKTPDTEFPVSIFPTASGETCGETITQLIFAFEQISASSKPIISQLESDLINHASDGITILEGSFNQLYEQYFAQDLTLSLQEKMAAIQNATQIDANEKMIALQIGTYIVDLKATAANLPPMDDPQYTKEVIGFIDQLVLAKNRLAISQDAFFGDEISSGADEMLQVCLFTATQPDCIINLEVNDRGEQFLALQEALGSFDPNHDYLATLAGSTLVINGTNLEALVTPVWNSLISYLPSFSGGQVKLMVEDEFGNTLSSKKITLH